MLAFNYLVAPFLMLGLANLFVTDPELHTGLVLYGLAPCIAMVIIFTFLAKGNTPMALVFVALNSVAQMLLIPVYARLLIGNVSFDVWIVAESVVLYLGLPLVLGVATRMLVVRRRGEAGMDALKPALNGVSILGLLFTLIVMFALKGDLILQRPGIVLEMAVPMTLFFVTMFFVVLVVGWRFRFSYRDAVAVAFNATGRDFEIAIAIAITAFSPTVALATVVGPLIEVPVMLFLVWSAMRLAPRLFGERADGGDPRGAVEIGHEQSLPLVCEPCLDLRPLVVTDAAAGGALIDRTRAAITRMLGVILRTGTPQDRGPRWGLAIAPSGWR